MACCASSADRGFWVLLRAFGPVFFAFWPRVQLKGQRYIRSKIIRFVGLIGCKQWGL